MHPFFTPWNFIIIINSILILILIIIIIIIIIVSYCIFQSFYRSKIKWAIKTNKNHSPTENTDLKIFHFPKSQQYKIFSEILLSR